MRIVNLQELDLTSQARLAELMDLSNEGQLSKQQAEELQSLVSRYEANMLANAESLLKANRPDSFGADGRARVGRLNQVLKKSVLQCLSRIVA